MSESLRVRAAAATLAVAGALAIGLPPEVRPYSGAVVALLLAVGVLSRGAGPHPGVVLAAAGAVLANVVLSVAPGRSLETAAALLLPVAAFVLARRVREEERTPAFVALALVGAALGVFALAQKGGFLAREALVAQELGLPEEMVLRLQRGRSFATHVVPAALGGALVTAIFSAGALATSAGRRRLGLACGALAAAGLVATASVGSLLALGAGGAVLAALRLGRRARIVIPAGAVALVLLIALATQLRPLPVFDLNDSNSPIMLRLGNWRGALLVAMERPVTGVGLGAFGAVYPSVRRGQDSETIYAHNSWLQLVAEGGLPAAALLALGFALAVGRAPLSGRLPARANRGPPPAPGTAWALAATAAFLVHNAVDFTLYLPGVSVPAAMLAGFAYSFRESASAPSPTRASRTRRQHRAGAFALAVLLAVTASVYVATGSARAAFEHARLYARDSAPDDAQRREAYAAARIAPWNSRISVQAVSVLMTSPAWSSATVALAASAAERDPASPEGWHLLARARVGARDVVGAWQAYDRAARRHPVDGTLRERRDAIGEALVRRGLLAAPLTWGAAAPGRFLPRALGWDSLLLLVQLAAALLVVVRALTRGGPGPPEVLGLCLIVLASVWADGGALPGARAGRHALFAVTLIAALMPRRIAGTRARGWTAGPILWLLPAAAWGALAASRAADGAAARDALVTLIGTLALLAFSREVSERYPAWPGILRTMIVVAAGAAAATWIAQSVGVALGADVSAWPGPLATEPLRPAGDFLHPGHYGTYLVASGLLLLGGMVSPRGADGPNRSRLLTVAAGFGLVICGLLPGARASLLALLGGGALLVVLALVARGGGARTRRVAAGFAALLVVAGLVGAFAVARRFSDTDRYAFGRLAIWPASIAAAAERPLTGFGPGGFRPVAPRYGVEEAGAVARRGRVFRGPHSDLLALPLLLGLPGALLLAAAFIRYLLAAWRSLAHEPLAAGMLAALAAIAAHAFVDDLFTERPAVAVLAALLLGTCAGRVPWSTLRDEAALESQRFTPRLPARLLVAVAIVSGLLAGELVPYVAWRAFVAGEADVASRLDPRRASFLIASARTRTGDLAERLLVADDMTASAVRLAPDVAAVRAERARLLSAACLGPLAERTTCGAARAAWGALLARNPGHPGPRLARARLALALGDPDRAVTDLLLALDDEPNFLVARDELIAAWSMLGQDRLAEAARAEQERRINALEGYRPQSAYERMLLSRSQRALPVPGPTRRDAS